MSDAASRKAKSRERDRAGLVWLSIETDRASLAAALEDLGLLDGMGEDTRERLARGLEELLRILYAARDAAGRENMFSLRN